MRPLHVRKRDLNVRDIEYLLGFANTLMFKVEQASSVDWDDELISIIDIKAKWFHKQYSFACATKWKRYWITGLFRDFQTTG